MVKKFSTTITAEYWAMKMEDAKTNDGIFYEYKNAVPFWETRLSGLEFPCPGTFLEGGKPHHVTVLAVIKIPSMMLDVWPSTERYRPAITEQECFAIKCRIIENNMPGAPSAKGCSPIQGTPGSGSTDKGDDNGGN